ncbi:MAG: hypothetical protein EKK41_00130 [Hyphomicrobiales bacterium]|nr:MAG: hypothetical protein EKK41_00130 [Hyphomicrobiales bacterium]
MFCLLLAAATAQRRRQGATELLYLSLDMATAIADCRFGRFTKLTIVGLLLCVGVRCDSAAEPDDSASGGGHRAGGAFDTRSRCRLRESLAGSCARC